MVPWSTCWVFPVLWSGKLTLCHKLIKQQRRQGGDYTRLRDTGGRLHRMLSTATRTDASKTIRPNVRIFFCHEMVLGTDAGQTKGKKKGRERLNGVTAHFSQNLYPNNSGFLLLKKIPRFKQEGGNRRRGVH